MKVQRKSTCVLQAALAVTLLCSAALTANAVTFTVKNNCGYTVYPGIYPAVYQNGGWSMSAGASVSFSVSSTFNGRIWGRQGCNSASPAQCSSGSCGGSGLQCAGTTGALGTSLAEFNLDASGTDWYDVSYVDGIDTPIGILISNSSCLSPNTSKSFSCPTTLKNGVDCLSPCTATGSAQYCCAGAYGSPSTCIVSQWPSNDQAYVTDIHNNCPHDYAYAYDDNTGLHTCAAGSNYTITFCPSGSGSTTGGTTGGTTGSTTGGGSISGLHTLAPQCATGSRLDDNAAGTTNGNKVQIWAANGSAAQQWNFSTSGVSPTGDYNLAVNLGPYCLDASGTASGSVAELWSCNGSTAQAWNVVADVSPSGYYQLKPASNGTLCLDVYGGASANGTKVDVYTCNGKSSQQWAIQ
jgi:hypothetical protein